MFPIDAGNLFAKTCFIPVLTISDLSMAVPLAQALVKGGLTVLEVTLRTPAAFEAIEAMTTAVPAATVGAGTILAAQDVPRALAAGAEFIVTPGTPPDLAAALVACPVPVLPGFSTVSEAMALAQRGFRTLKLFPAEALGGVDFIKAIGGPLPDLKFCPTGGISAARARDYLALRNVGAVGGSWVVPDDALATGDYARITALAAQATALRR